MHFLRLTAIGGSLAALGACQEQRFPPVQALPARDTCYAYQANKDTVQLALHTAEAVVTGQLTYRYFEKDRNQGTLRGAWYGDTLRATYTFQAEGSESKREVVFLRRGAQLVEGTGSTTMRGGQEVFQQPRQLRFDKLPPLAIVPCGK